MCPVCVDGATRFLGQPEVGQVGVSTLVEQDIPRLDVAVDEPLRVRRIERVCEPPRIESVRSAGSVPCLRGGP
jgi:hypothetical protein